MNFFLYKFNLEECPEIEYVLKNGLRFAAFLIETKTFCQIKEK